MLSVIIPVYNTEQTLDACVQSVLEQHVDDMEVILVDDGSPDNAPALCNQWAQRNPHIRVIHQRNAGLSAARNAGLDAARGNVIAFVDSDDCVAPHTYGPCLDLLAQHPDADLIEFPYHSVRQAGAEYRKLQGRHVPQKAEEHGTNTDVSRPSAANISHDTYTKMNCFWVYTGEYAHAYAWNKLYRAHLWKEVRFPVGHVFEDLYTLPHILDRCRKVMRMTGTMAGYLYTVNAQGITTRAATSAPYYAALFDAALKAWLKYAHTLNGGPQVQAMTDRYYLQLFNIQVQYCFLSGQKPTLPHRHLHLTLMPLPLMVKTCLVNLLGAQRAAAAIARFKRLAHR